LDHLSHAIERLSHRLHLSSDEAGAAFDVVMRGEATDDRIKELLLGLKEKGETSDEVAGAAGALRRAMTRLPIAPHFAPRTSHLVDTCGTGGGLVGTFNISTTAAFVAAGAGVSIAKHGNRSFTSRSGSADVLEALGIDIGLTPERAASVLEEVGLVFLFAPNYHPAMKHAAPVRKELKTTTIFNLLGPLANPASVTRQVIGVSDPERGPLVAEALGRLGAEHALVVHAEVGMDEIAPAGLTRVWEIRRSTLEARSTKHDVREWVLDPADHDLRHEDLGALKGGEPSENAARLDRLLRPASAGEDPAGRAAVLLNAAAAIYVSAEGVTFAQAVDRARAALEAGKGATVLHRLREASR
jgi:anthranilate phosphoribosyltransferase